MSRIGQIITEIAELKGETNHRSALRILSLLENNKKLFLEKMDGDYLEMAIKNFRALCDTPSRDYNSAGYKRDHQNFYESLTFHLNRII